MLYPNKKAYLFTLKKPFSVLETTPQPLIYSEAIEQRIEALWEKGRLSKDLFNGTVLSLQSYHENTFFVMQVPYKVCFAAIQDSTLRRLLGIYPFCVCGRTICNRAILLARRASTLATDAGQFECCPSGGVESLHIRADHSVDLQAALMQEFCEEIRLPTALIQEVEPKYVVWTVEGGVFDICFDIKLHSDVILPHENVECAEFRWWHPGDSTLDVIASTTLLLEQYTNDI